MILKSNGDPNVRGQNDLTGIMIGMIVFLWVKDINFKINIFPLYTVACIKANERILDIMLKNGANPNIINHDSSTPLIHGRLELITDKINNNWFSASENEYDKIVKLLLRSNANPNIQDSNHSTAFFVIRQQQHLDRVYLLH